MSMFTSFANDRTNERASERIGSISSTNAQFSFFVRLFANLVETEVLNDLAFLAVPPTSASGERPFSKTSYVLKDERWAISA